MTTNQRDEQGGGAERRLYAPWVGADAPTWPKVMRDTVKRLSRGQPVSGELLRLVARTLTTDLLADDGVVQSLLQPMLVAHGGRAVGAEAADAEDGAEGWRALAERVDSLLDGLAAERGAVVTALDLLVVHAAIEAGARPGPRGGGWGARERTAWRRLPAGVRARVGTARRRLGSGRVDTAEVRELVGDRSLGDLWRIVLEAVPAETLAAPDVLPLVLAGIERQMGMLWMRWVGEVVARLATVPGARGALRGWATMRLVVHRDVAGAEALGRLLAGVPLSEGERCQVAVQIEMLGVGRLVAFAADGAVVADPVLSAALERRARVVGDAGALATLAASVAETTRWCGIVDALREMGATEQLVQVIQGWPPAVRPPAPWLAALLGYGSREVREVVATRMRQVRTPGRGGGAR